MIRKRPGTRLTQVREARQIPLASSADSQRKKVLDIGGWHFFSTASCRTAKKEHESGYQERFHYLKRLLREAALRQRK